MTVTEQVAIIGAGLCGLMLALALHQQSIPCIVYEGRPAPEDIGGAIILSPNALRIPDELHIYPRIRHLGHESQTVLFRTEDNQLVDSYEIGNEEKYGYKGLRIYRYGFITELLALLAERRIPVHYWKSSRAYAPGMNAISSASWLSRRPSQHSRLAVWTSLTGDDDPPELDDTPLAQEVEAAQRRSHFWKLEPL
ncbi:hypothetical protein CDV55_105724 [Aspergillus turcosus]|nr:hypothetical protein CDV55_105724 [Aspergillus turcosus]